MLKLAYEYGIQLPFNLYLHKSKKQKGFFFQYTYTMANSTYFSVPTTGKM